MGSRFTQLGLYRLFASISTSCDSIFKFDFLFLSLNPAPIVLSFTVDSANMEVSNEFVVSLYYEVEKAAIVGKGEASFLVSDCSLKFAWIANEFSILLTFLFGIFFSILLLYYLLFSSAFSKFYGISYVNLFSKMIFMGFYGKFSIFCSNLMFGSYRFAYEIFLETLLSCIITEL